MVKCFVFCRLFVFEHVRGKFKGLLEEVQGTIGGGPGIGTKGADAREGGVGRGQAPSHLLNLIIGTTKAPGPQGPYEASSGPEGPFKAMKGLGP